MQELALLCDCDIGLIVVNDAGKATSFSTGSLAQTFDRIRNSHLVKEHNSLTLADVILLSCIVTVPRCNDANYSLFIYSMQDSVVRMEIEMKIYLTCLPTLQTVLHSLR